MNYQKVEIVEKLNNLLMEDDFISKIMKYFILFDGKFINDKFNSYWGKNGNSITIEPDCLMFVISADSKYNSKQWENFYDEYFIYKFFLILFYFRSYGKVSSCFSSEDLTNMYELFMEKVARTLDSSKAKYLGSCFELYEDILDECRNDNKNLKDSLRHLDITFIHHAGFALDTNSIVNIPKHLVLFFKLLENYLHQFVYESIVEICELSKNKNNKSIKHKSGGCYIATCVYGSYNCPSVYVLRRFRDNFLASFLLGKLFIKFYYFISPKLVMIFGKNKIFKFCCKSFLDKVVKLLLYKGYDNSVYNDKTY